LDTVAHGVRAALELALGPLDGLSPLIGMLILSAVSGAIMLWVVGRVTSQHRIERARSLIAASVYEMRLYLDSPRRIISAQGRMLRATGAYMLWLTPAFAVLTLPLGLLYVHVDLRYGVAPLPLDRPAVVRVALDADAYEAHADSVAAVDPTSGEPLEPTSGEPLEPTSGGPLEPTSGGDAQASEAGYAVTAPPLRAAHERAVYLRIALLRPGDHSLAIRVGDRRVAKRLSAGGRPVSPQRCRGVAAWWCEGVEPPLDPAAGVSSISVIHPAVPQRWLGTSMPWWVCWLILSTIAALVLRRPMGVVL
jgi:hypothetical protein